MGDNAEKISPINLCLLNYHDTTNRLRDETAVGIIDQSFKPFSFSSKNAKYLLILSPQMWQRSAFVLRDHKMNEVARIVRNIFTIFSHFIDSRLTDNENSKLEPQTCC